MTRQLLGFALRAPRCNSEGAKAVYSAPLFRLFTLLPLSFPPFICSLHTLTSQSSSKASGREVMLNPGQESPVGEFYHVNNIDICL